MALPLLLDVRRIETFCVQYYSSPSPDDRSVAHSLLSRAFPSFSATADPTSASASNQSPTSATDAQSQSPGAGNPEESVFYCKKLLDASPNPYAQLYFTTKLRDLLSNHWNLFRSDQMLEMRNFVLTYIFQHPDLQPYVIASLAQLLATQTKLGWFDGEEFKAVADDMGTFLQASTDHQIVGLHVLGILVSEFDLPASQRNAARNRKTASAFRDTQLLQIFQTGLAVLEDLVERRIMFTKPHHESKLKEYCLTLIRNCLCFDFLGTSADESGEDVGSVQIPSSWRAVYEKPNLLRSIFAAYGSFGSQHSGRVMECLVQIASTRRTLFTEESKSRFVDQLIQGISSILQTSQGMDDVLSFHEFCRMLSRFRATYHWGDLSGSEGFDKWLDLVADFSRKGFQAWQWSPNSVPYILAFWSKMVSPNSSSRSVGNSKLESISSQLVREFITSKLDTGFDDDDNAATDQLELLANLARYQYDISSKIVENIFEALGGQYYSLVQESKDTTSAKAKKEAIESLNVKFSLLVCVIGAFVGARQVYQSTEEHDMLDGRLSAEVLKLMNLTQLCISKHGEQHGSERLDLAYLYFFRKFRNTYIEENGQRASKVYAVLSEFSLNDQTMVLNVLVQKLGTNLKTWAHNPAIITQTLQLLDDLSSGYSSVKMLRRLDTTKFFLSNHKDFPFLDVPKNKGNRIIYYSALSKILFAEECSDKAFFDFMRPFSTAFNGLATLHSMEGFRQDAVKATISGLFRDLRGFVHPIQTKKAFNLFFNWFYPSHMRILLGCLDSCGNDPVAVVLLKFFAEFVHNKSQRLMFDISSPNGILLFREASKVLVSYGRQVLQKKDETMQQMGTTCNTEKYKGISTCFRILTNAFGGRYTNFGVFPLYDDKALVHARATMFELMTSVPLEDMMSFPKMTLSYFCLIEVFSNELMMTMESMASPEFLYIMQTCAEGLKSTDSGVCTASCNTLDHIFTFVVHQNQREEDTSATLPNLGAQCSSSGDHYLLEMLRQFPWLLSYLFSTLFYVVLFEDRTNQWSLSRPLLPMMLLLNKEYLEGYIKNLIDCQLPYRRPILEKAIHTLISELDGSLTPRSRDEFTQNLNMFRREISSNNLVLIPPPDYSSM